MRSRGLEVLRPEARWSKQLLSTALERLDSCPSASEDKIHDSGALDSRRQSQLGVRDPCRRFVDERFTIPGRALTNWNSLASRPQDLKTSRSQDLKISSPQRSCVLLRYTLRR